MLSAKQFLMFSILCAAMLLVSLFYGGYRAGRWCMWMECELAVQEMWIAKYEVEEI